MIFFTSDLHFWHNNILHYTKRSKELIPGRTIVTVEDMNERIIEMYNARVAPYTDEVYFLGDIMMGGGKDMPDRMQRIFSRLNGKKYLIKGNHDYKYCDQPWFSKHFEWVKDIHEFKMKGYPMMVLHHFPHYSWHGMGRDAIMVHGHCHGNIDKANLKTRRIDVGIDAMYSNYAPLSVDEICRIMKERKTELVDHHGSRDNME